MTVTHLATTAADGAGIATRRIHEALLAAGADSHLLVRDPGNIGPGAEVAGQPPPALTERLARRLPFACGIRAKHARSLTALLARPGPAPELFSLPFARARPEDHLRTRTADIVHLHWVSGFVDFPRFFQPTLQPLVWTLHDQQPYLGGLHYELDYSAHPDFHPLEAECRALKRAALARLPRAPLVIGNSRWNTDAARASGFFPPGTRFETVYYPLDTAVYTPRDKTASKVALGLDPRTTVIGFACTSLENTRKGLSDLLAALRLLEALPEITPLTLLSFGRSPSESLRASLRSRWQHLGFLDADSVKCTAYSAMDCFVIPSRAEAFGQTAIEALASGTCVLGAQVGGIPETMPTTSHANVLFPPGNPRALADRLRAVLSAVALRGTLAREGRDHVLRQHAPSGVAAQYLALYETLTQHA
ncbi:MAG: glycosyltransferase [Opitutaceae bacterium]|nr:glycosyltransferase [Opitutaceae bacterium]